MVGRVRWMGIWKTEVSSASEDSRNGQSFSSLTIVLCPIAACSPPSYARMAFPTRLLHRRPGGKRGPLSFARGWNDKRPLPGE